MKQSYLFDKEEQAAFRRGEPFEMHVAGQIIVLQFDVKRRTNGAAPEPEPKRRRYTDAERRAMARYAKTHGATEAAAKFGCNPSVVYRALKVRT
jgi:hypothetical protein